jgi:uroporphyrinogen-III synthase
MTSRLIVLRPEPGASATAKRALDDGWTVTILPLFEIAPLVWNPPEPKIFDAVLMTSANSARFGGPGLAGYHGLPLYAVGTKTADAAHKNGFETIIIGEGGVAEMADQLRADNMARIFHPAGKTARPFDESKLSIIHMATYAASRVTPQDFVSVIGKDAILLIHSPLSARYLDELCAAQAIARNTLSLVAISTAALTEAGTGWRAAIAAERPTDAAMLTAASSLGGADAIR